MGRKITVVTAIQLYTAAFRLVPDLLGSRKVLLSRFLFFQFAAMFKKAQN